MVKHCQPHVPKSVCLYLRIFSIIRARPCACPRGRLPGYTPTNQRGFSIIRVGARPCACPVGYDRELTTSAPITPGTQPTIVSNVTNKTVPHPLSRTASGGKRIHSNARPQPIGYTPS